jgi:short-subunit dehydrogenase
LKGKTVVITGGSSGIGKALAVKFAQMGFNVVITGRDPSRLNNTSDQIQQTGAGCLSLVSDVSKWTDCEAVVAETLRRFGSIDVLINNAGISMRGILEETDISVIEQLMAINFWGTVYMTKLSLPHLLKSKGSVVGISSIAGKVGLPGRCAYSASKYAMEGFLSSVRTENIRKGLHVLVACPGFTASSIRKSSLGPNGKPQGESPRDESGMMTAEAVADHIYQAVVNRKRDLVLTANGKLTVFLNKWFPSLTDKLVFNHMSKEPGSPF